MATKRMVKHAAKVAAHMTALRAIFKADPNIPDAELFASLRHLEARAQRYALRLCNGPEFQDETERAGAENGILARLDELTGFRMAGVPCFVNGDPRGYGLKIEDEWVRVNAPGLERDWGGYGIIAPDFGGEK